MNITVISVGKIKEKYFTAAIDEYSKRLSRFAKLNIIEVADEKIPDNASETNVALPDEPLISETKVAILTFLKLIKPADKSQAGLYF